MKPPHLTPKSATYAPTYGIDRIEPNPSKRGKPYTVSWAGGYGTTNESAATIFQDWDLNFSSPFLSEADVRSRLLEIDNHRTSTPPAGASSSVPSCASASSADEPSPGGQPLLWIGWMAEKLRTEHPTWKEGRAWKQAEKLQQARITSEPRGRRSSVPVGLSFFAEY
jgi:hypothetical protein